MLKTLTGLLQRINDVTHTPHKHDLQPLLTEMRRASAALSRLEQNTKQRIALYDALDALYVKLEGGITDAKLEESDIHPTL